MDNRASEVDRRRKLTDLLIGFFETQHLGVLATQKNGEPYASLVGVAASPDLKHLVFTTRRGSRKYENLNADSRVAMLVDSRSNRSSDFQEAIAVTVIGRAEESRKTEENPLFGMYLSKHPQLREFAMSPDCALVKITVEKYLIVSKFEEVSELIPLS